MSATRDSQYVLYQWIPKHQANAKTKKKWKKLKKPPLYVSLIPDTDLDSGAWDSSNHFWRVSKGGGEVSLLVIQGLGNTATFGLMNRLPVDHFVWHKKDLWIVTLRDLKLVLNNQERSTRNQIYIKGLLPYLHDYRRHWSLGHNTTPVQILYDDRWSYTCTAALWWQVRLHPANARMVWSGGPSDPAGVCPWPCSSGLTHCSDVLQVVVPDPF